MSFIPKIDLDRYKIKKELLAVVPETMVRKYGVVPVFKMGGTITFAVPENKNMEVIEAFQREIGKEIDIVYAEEDKINRAIAFCYGEISSNYTALASSVNLRKPSSDFEQKKRALEILTQDENESPIINLVNRILLQAIGRRASDIHIEPSEDESLIRIRVDGELQRSHAFPRALHLEVVSRIKIMGDLDIAESRVPQDGKAQIEVSGKPFELRISSLPTIQGENIVIRILDKSSLKYSLDGLGFTDSDLVRLKELIGRPYGMILATGPTGSGKTSTLYSILNTVSTLSKNIVTLEDPVEYQIPLIRQVQVNSKAGLTFASGLKSILRQDPDIIMVGEIRDLETAELAVRSSLTGHLVYSTLHTNDAPGAVTRMIDMGVEPFLAASSLTGVLAQRLVRRVCANCRAPFTPSPQMLKALSLDPNHTYFRGKGCSKCNRSGYFGRMGIFELMVITEEMKEKITTGSPSRVIRELALAQGMRSLRQAAIDKIQEGLTTPEEAISTTQHHI